MCNDQKPEMFQSIATNFGFLDLNSKYQTSVSNRKNGDSF